MTLTPGTNNPTVIGLLTAVPYVCGAMSLVCALIVLYGLPESLRQKDASR